MLVYKKTKIELVFFLRQALSGACPDCAKHKSSFSNFFQEHLPILKINFKN